jgi:hypothetical protein
MTDHHDHGDPAQHTHHEHQAGQPDTAHPHRAQHRAPGT